MSSATLSVTNFKAQCLELFERLTNGSLDRVEVTKRGKVVAVVSPPPTDEAQARAVHGSMAGLTVIPPDLDLVAPVFEGELDAELGLLHR